MNRSIQMVLPAEEMDMGGFPIRQAWPCGRMQQLDPFVLLHHGAVSFPKTIKLDTAGVGPHPHKGFSPVSFIFKGGVHHRDSRGHDSVIHEGGVQWMNAGSGIMHSERPAPDIHEHGGMMELIQMWVNMPASQKHTDPVYLPLKASERIKLDLPDPKAEIFVVSGTLSNSKGPIPTPSPVISAMLYFQAGGKADLPIPASHNAFLYLLDGSMTVNGKIVPGKNAVIFKRDGDLISLEAKEDTRALLMSGEPLNEPMVAHGPFVMNTEQQILQAIQEFRTGRMGALEK